MPWSWRRRCSSSERAAEAAESVSAWSVFFPVRRRVLRPRTVTAELAAASADLVLFRTLAVMASAAARACCSASAGAGLVLFRTLAVRASAATRACCSASSAAAPWAPPCAAAQARATPRVAARCAVTALEIMAKALVVVSGVAAAAVGWTYRGCRLAHPARPRRTTACAGAIVGTPGAGCVAASRAWARRWASVSSLLQGRSAGELCTALSLPCE